MMGHRIGMLENNAGLRQYLQDVRPFLKPEGQILLTVLDVSTINEATYRSNPALNSLQFQQINLIGPFFAMLRIRPDAMKKQAVAASWQCEILYQQDENNYITRLNPC
jgi:hypothetical protein